ncbi:MAG: tetratricopeptide repeat protein [Planctomycetia bacterium]|nr:tetratricopeptide repeat protein [Planctomycetia bacterium]
MQSARSSQSTDALAGLRVAFAGKLAGMSKRAAQQLVRANGGNPVESIDSATDLVVVAEQSPSVSLSEALGREGRLALEEGRLVVVNETQLWQRLGLVEQDPHVTRMYTPAMLAELVGVPVATVRRWHRRRLLVARRQVGHLPYFDFSQVATARQLAALSSAGVSQRLMEKQFAALARRFPGATSGAHQAALVVEGKRLLVRQGDGLLEAGGQQRFDFDEPRTVGAGGESDEPMGGAVLSLEVPADAPLAAPAEMVEQAQILEDEGQLAEAADMYRAALAAGGPHPETCFSLAELLYRMGDTSAARERYYMAIELDENFVEARANLGCVLAESGQLELAVSAFEGALAFHAEFPDAHYHLGRVLDELCRGEEALTHWRAFLDLAPDSPWAETARQRLSM